MGSALSADNILQRADRLWRSWFASVPLWRRSFFRNVAVVAGGNVIAQIIALAFSPIITRLYGPEAFGILGVFTSVVSLGTPAATLAYGQAIVLPARDEDALRLLRFASLFSGFVALVALLIIVPFQRSLALALGMGNAAPYLLLVPIAILWGGMSRTFDQWLIRKKQFQASSGITIAERFLTNGAKACAGLVAPVAGTLVGIAVAGRGLHTLLTFWCSRETRRQAAHAKLTVSNLFDEQGKALLHAYRDFPIYRLPQVLLNSASHSLPVVLLASFFDPTTAGLYTIGHRALQLPASLIGSAVGKVFKQRIAEAAHRGEALRALIIKATLALAVAGFLPFALIIILGPMLFAFVFGPEWRTAGVYARWLAMWSFSMFLNRPSVESLALLDLQKELLGFEVFVVVARSTAIILGAQVIGDDIMAIALYSIVGVVVNLLLIGYVIHRSRFGTRRLDLDSDEETFNVK